MKLQANLQDVTSLLDNLLFWSQSQMGQNNIESKPIRIVELIKRNIDLYRVSALQKDINIEFKHYNGDPIIVGDENIVNLVMRNLLNNAIKYSNKQSSITVDITSQNGHLAVSVKDRGVGISKKLQRHIFENEYHNTTRGTSNEKGDRPGVEIMQGVS